MNIIILGPREPIPPTRGGAIEKLTLGLAKNLAKQGHNIVIISTCEKPGSIYEIEGVEVICIAKPISGSRFYFKEMPIFSAKARRIIEKIAKNELDKDNTVVHSFYFYNLMSFYSFNRMPIVVTESEHYPWVSEYLYHRPFITSLDMIKWESDSMIRRLLAQVIMPKANMITFISNYQREMALRKIKLIDSKSIVVPPAVDTNFYRPMKTEEFRESLSDGAEVLLLFVGRQTPHKGFHILMKSLTKLEPRYRRRLKLIVVGPKVPGFLYASPHRRGAYTQYINFLIRRYDLQDIIRFVGQIQEEEMPIYYNSVDLLIHPSFVEAFGLVLIEAMACGKPVLAFDIPPMNEVVINGVSGVLVKPSVESLAEALRNIVDNIKTLKPIGIRARYIAESRYSWQVISSMYSRLYTCLR